MHDGMLPLERKDLLEEQRAEHQAAAKWLGITSAILIAAALLLMLAGRHGLAVLALAATVPFGGIGLNERMQLKRVEAEQSRREMPAEER